MSKVLFKTKDGPVNIQTDGRVTWTGELTVDGDGCPTCYHPDGSPPGLDYLANAGRPGNWWGIALDAKGRPIIQGADDPAPGFYVSTTAYKRAGYKHGDPQRELNSDTVPFIVVPSGLIKAVPGVILGAMAQIEDLKTGREVRCVVGDIGPAHHLGEASMAVARALGLNADPKHGGSSERRFLYTVWPDFAAPGFRLQPAMSRATVAAVELMTDVVYVA